MKKRKFFPAFVILPVLSAAVLSSCATSRNVSQTAVSEIVKNEAEATLVEQNSNETNPSGADSQADIPGQLPAIVLEHTYDIAAAVSVDDSKTIIEKVRKAVEEKGGVLLELTTSLYDNAPVELKTEEESEENEEDIYSDYYDYYYSDTFTFKGKKYTEWSELTILVPEDQSAGFLEDFAAVCEVLAQEETIADHTAAYKKLAQKKMSLEAEEQRLKSMIETVISSDRFQKEKEVETSGQLKEGTEGEGLLESLTSLENNLWYTRKELDNLLYGESEYSSYSLGSKSLLDYEQMQGNVIFNINICVENTN